MFFLISILFARSNSDSATTYGNLYHQLLESQLRQQHYDTFRAPRLHPEDVEAARGRNGGQVGPGTAVQVTGDTPPPSYEDLFPVSNGNAQDNSQVVADGENISNDDNGGNNSSVTSGRCSKRTSITPPTSNDNEGTAATVQLERSSSSP